MSWSRANLTAAVAVPAILLGSVLFGSEDAHAIKYQPIEYPVPDVYTEYEQCVRERESDGQWDAVNPTGTYRGAYQFDAALARGATFHMGKDIGAFLMTKDRAKIRAYARYLRSIPMDKWKPYLQTAAFVRTLDGHDKNQPWSGIDHWAGGRWHCGR